MRCISLKRSAFSSRSLSAFSSLSPARKEEEEEKPLSCFAVLTGYVLPSKVKHAKRAGQPTLLQILDVGLLRAAVAKGLKALLGHALSLGG